jgi:hypothetical protein
MSKIGNHVVDIQETEDFQFGWQSAERGDPNPSWEPTDLDGMLKFARQVFGWASYHHQERSL